MKRDRIPVVSEKDAEMIMKSIANGMAREFNLPAEPTDKMGGTFWAHSAGGKSVTYCEDKKERISVSVTDCVKPAHAALALAFNEVLDGYEFWAREAMSERGIVWEKKLFAEYTKRICNCRDLRKE